MIDHHCRVSFWTQPPSIGSDQLAIGLAGGSLQEGNCESFAKGKARAGFISRYLKVTKNCVHILWWLTCIHTFIHIVYNNNTNNNNIVVIIRIMIYVYYSYNIYIWLYIYNYILFNYDEQNSSISPRIDLLWCIYIICTECKALLCLTNKQINMNPVFLQRSFLQRSFLQKRCCTWVWCVRAHGLCRDWRLEVAV